MGVGVRSRALGPVEKGVLALSDGVWRYRAVAVERQVALCRRMRGKGSGGMHRKGRK